MTRRLLLCAALAATLFGSAQNKLDMNSAMLVHDHAIIESPVHTDAQKASAARQLQTLGVDNSGYVGLLVKLTDDATAADLQQAGAEVLSVRGGVAAVRIPVGSIPDLAALPAVRSISCGSQQPQLCYARATANANGVLDGTAEGLTQPYSGVGVITGLMDQGIDPNHVNFLNRDMTESRVKAVYTFLDSDGSCSEYTTPEQIADFTTDGDTWTHATHVCGIMAGAYDGNANYGYNYSTYTNQPIPYWGVAYGADIVMSAGTLYDINIATGVDKVITYAKAAEKPAVVNLSLGSLIGPHDGTSNISQYLAGAGQDAIICIAAGNDGGSYCAMSGTFTEENPTISTATYFFTNNANYIQFWNSDSDAFGVELLIVDTSTKEIIAAAQANDIEKLVEFSASDDNDFSNALAQAYSSSGSIKLYSYVDENNNRFNTTVYYSLPRVSGTSNTNYVLGFRLTGTSGDTVNGYIGGGAFNNYSIEGWADGTRDGSISDLACGDNVIVVGAYTSSSFFTTLSGNAYSYVDHTNANEICYFSSFGTTTYGKNLPNLCGPGSAVVSSGSYYYYGDSPSSTTISGTVTYDGRPSQWVAMQGTSMACPFVSGTVALMLEADPTLNYADALDILIATTVAPDASLSSLIQKQWGAGRLDVLAAVKRTLDVKSATVKIWEDQTKRLIIDRPDGDWRIYVAGESGLTVNVYDLRGTLVGTFAADGSEVLVPASSLPSGLYVAKIVGKTSYFTSKIVK